MKDGLLRASWMAVGSTAAMLLPGPALAHEEAPSAEVVVKAATRDDLEPGLPPVGADDLGPELRWSRLLTGSLSLQADLQPPLVRADLDRASGLLLGQSGVFSGMATAAGSLVTDGFALVEIRRRGVARQRHFVHAFFARGGITLVWRIEF
jgi:hypothetical protein